MAAVPQKTLNWLYGVLGREYRDQNRAYNDIAQTLSQYPSLAPRTDVYTYENGAPALLLQLTGTLPVQFRTETYRFPITIWIPHAYPLEAPMVYITPTEGMIVRPGQHVGGEGKVYHHFLAHWREAWNRANIVEFLQILSAIFAKDPPVMVKPQYTTRQPPQQSTSRPAPPLPPVPPEIHRPPSGQSHYTSGPMPPLPPPKQRDDGRLGRNSSLDRPRSRYDAPPPLPPEAGGSPRSPQANGSGSRLPSQQSFQPQRQSSLSHSMLAQAPPSPQVSQYRGDPNAPPWSPFPQGHLPPQPYPDQQGQPQAPQYNRAPVQQPLATTFGGIPYHGQPGPVYSHDQQQLPQQPQAGYSQQIQPPQKLPPPPDLLDSPFDISLPVVSSLPAPPVPRNPEKDMLLSTLSNTLTQTLHQSITQNASALPSLQARHQAMAITYQQLQNEHSNLAELSATLSSNNALLSSSLQKSDRAIASARDRAAKGDIPKVDEMVTAPTVVGRQLYDIVCEERGVEAAIWALQEGFVRGRIGSEVWSKQTRNLAREGFRKRYLARKVGRGMGLDMHGFE